MKQTLNSTKSNTKPSLLLPVAQPPRKRAKKEESEPESEPDESEDQFAPSSTVRRSSRSSTRSRKIPDPKPFKPSSRRTSSRNAFTSSPEYVEEKISSDDDDEESVHDKRPKRNSSRQSAAKEQTTTRCKSMCCHETNLEFDNGGYLTFFLLLPVTQPPRKRAKIEKDSIFPNLKRWPRIEMKHVSNVTKGIISALVSAFFVPFRSD